MAKYRRTFSSGGKKVSTANQVVDFAIDMTSSDIDCNVQYFKFETFATPCSIKLNGEATVHWLDANSEIVFEDINIDRFEIVEAGVEHYYTAMSQE